MKARNFIFTALIGFSLLSGITACKSQADKDKELKSKIEATAPGVTVSVDNGVVTLSGTVNDDDAKKNLEETVKKVDGVKSVTNNLEVPPPPVINPDQMLIDAMNAIGKDYPKVKFDVVNGEITLTGEITRDELPKLMQKVQESKPKKVNNNLVVK